MGFKSDREFLRNITVGAVGNRKIVQHLNAAGFRIIELERGSLGNKIWGTKIKRLRVPDLLCLRSGTRIESRAKGKLKIIMSHAQKNPDRAWDKGLRDSEFGGVHPLPFDRQRQMGGEWAHRVLPGWRLEGDTTACQSQPYEVGGGR